MSFELSTEMQTLMLNCSAHENTTVWFAEGCIFIDSLSSSSPFLKYLPRGVTMKRIFRLNEEDEMAAFTGKGKRMGEKFIAGNRETVGNVYCIELF